jgi:hypothetical protein
MYYHLMSHAPAYLYADDHAVYRRELLAHEHAQAQEGAMPGLSDAHRDALRAHDRAVSLEHFAALAWAALRARPAWRPSAFLLSAIAARGLSWADVDAALSARCAWCARPDTDAAPLAAHDGRRCCAACIACVHVDDHAYLCACPACQRG